MLMSIHGLFLWELLNFLILHADLLSSSKGCVASNEWRVYSAKYLEFDIHVNSSGVFE